MIRPITLNFLEPMVFLLNLYIALIYGILYIWFESFPIVFTGIYRFNLSEEGLAFIGILLGALLVMWVLPSKRSAPGLSAANSYRSVRPFSGISIATPSLNLTKMASSNPKNGFPQPSSALSAFRFAFSGLAGLHDQIFTGSCLSLVLHGFLLERSCCSIPCSITSQVS